ncbi:MAG TPA: tRNA guanosine(15) transglycosylase TgtA [Methanomassiliicoccales archaeon]|nr:tRNA guanosine(15) transglycosylase TgtA [Methanomassiliicoccales archaeon]
MLELLRRDGLARIASFETRHGTLETPCLLPVVNPRLVTIPPKELKAMGFQALITNSYIIRSDPAMKEKALSQGLHSMLDFDGVIMTDSGTFQSHMYGEVEVANEDIVAFQRDAGADIGTVLDIFTEPEWGKERTANAVKVTLERTEQAAAIKGRMMLAGVVQGSVHADLRAECARSLSSLPVDVFPIGGVVPLMEGYRFADLIEVIVASKMGLTPERPVHLFGAGHPMVFSLAILLGCDMFDSASYAKFARDGRMMFPEGTFHLDEMKGLDCDCPACRNHTIESLKELPEQERTRALALHNLHVSKREIDRAKRALLEGNLWELVEQRCRAHPALLDALRALGKHKMFLERYEPLSREGAFFYTGPESLDRPSAYRYERRYFERYTKPRQQLGVVFPDAERPYSRVYAKEMREISQLADAHFLVISPFGPVPMELDEVYPIAQSVFPRTVDRDTEERTKELMERFSHGHEYGVSILFEGEETMSMIESFGEGKGTFDLDLARVKAVSDYQFGKGANDLLMDGKVELVKSKNTHKIRNVLVDGEHVLSMRAPDGFFSLRPPGAKRLMKGFASPRLRVMVAEDSEAFNREGKNVFCHFVKDCDPGIVPMDEVMVVSESDALLAVGRALMTREEMLAFKKGLAVRVREGVKL